MCLEDANYDLIIGNVLEARRVDDPDPTWKPGVSAASVETTVEVKIRKVLSLMKVPGHPEEAVT